VLSIESYSSEQQRAVKRVMARLAQLEKMESRRHRGKRQFERATYNSTAILRIEADDQHMHSNESCTVWTRDISRGGASFICPFEVLGKKVVLGFKLADGTVKWYPAEIVRERQIPDELFWEYGTVFRATESDGAPE
jgi:hypothetical protein